MLVQEAIIIMIFYHIQDVAAENGTFYTLFNATDKFFEFKAKYNKVYESTKDEDNHYLSFVNNLNEAAALNATLSDSDTYYVLNKYADLHPEEVEERYGIHLKTYYKVEKGDIKELLRSDQGIEINDDNLHDINNAEEIFNEYLEEQRRNITNNRNNFVRFYRFVRKLVEKNIDAFKQNDTAVVHQKNFINPKFVRRLVEKNIDAFKQNDTEFVHLKNVKKPKLILNHSSEFFY